jgi:hypothetical protein
LAEEGGRAARASRGGLVDMEDYVAFLNHWLKSGFDRF